MTSSVKLGEWNNPSIAINSRYARQHFGSRHSASSIPLSRCCSLNLRLQSSRFASLTLQSHSDSMTDYTAAVGSPSSSPTLPPSHWNLTQRHLLALNFIACATAVSVTWLFFSAIPTILAFKRAAESLEKLMDTTREELPDTMATIRLSGMEISDLTMELSDLGQEITQGVRSSTRAVRVAEERLRSFTNIPSTASLQTVASPKTETRGPTVASTAREIKEGIVKGRSILRILFTLVGFSRTAFNYFGKRVKR